MEGALADFRAARRRLLLPTVAGSILQQCHNVFQDPGQQENGRGDLQERAASRLRRAELDSQVLQTRVVESVSQDARVLSE